MARWQTHVVHPLTAFLFASTAAIAAARYQILDIPFAPHLIFALTAASYLMLSRKYDPILSAIFFGIALFVTFKTAMAPAPKGPHGTFTAAQSLIVAMAELRVFQIQNDRPPSENDLLKFPLSNPIVMCNPQTCPHTPEPQSLVWLSLKHDKHDGIWYINDRFELFRQEPGGSFTRMDANLRTQ